MRLLFPIAIVFGLLGTIASPLPAQRYSQSQTKVSPADFPLVVHVTGSHFSAEAQGILFVDAAIKGERIKMETNALTGLMREGDYKARLASEHEGKNGDFSKSYEILFKDGSHHFFNVIGTAE